MPRYLPALLLLPLILAADWPQWRGPDRDGTWHEKGLPTTLPRELPRLWKQPIGGGYGGIAVRAGKLFVLDRQKGPPEVERVLCLDATTGKSVWTHSYEVHYGRLDYGNGPRSTPTVHRGKVYTLGALGHLCCLEEQTGKSLWTRDTVRDFKGTVPTWGHACSPLVDGNRLIVQVGGKVGACLVALDLDTGKEIWRSLDDPPGYASPVLVEKGKWRQLLYFTPRHMVGLEPATGKVLWKEPFEGITYDVSISDLVFSEGIVLASNYWSGSKAVRLDATGRNPKLAWEGKQLSLLMSTPLVRHGHVYALDRNQGLLCLEAKSGKVLWQGEHVTPRDRNPQASLTWVGEDRALVLTTPGDLVLVELTPRGLRRLGKAALVGRTWANPGFGQGCVFARNDEEIVCARLVDR